MNVSIRPAAPSDATTCGTIVFNAFRSLHEKHGFPPIFRNEELAIKRVSEMIGHPAYFGIVAELDGAVAGLNFMSECDPIRGIGPIAIDPAAQGHGVGRMLMVAALDRAKGHPIRLLQETINMQSLSLYSSLGFETKDIYVLCSGAPQDILDPVYEIRPMQRNDLQACEALQMAVLGFTRINELAGSLAAGCPLVLERAGKIAAYIVSPLAWVGSHAVSETQADLQSLILGAAQISKEVAILLPIRAASLFKWALASGLRAVRPCTLMTVGAYSDPGGRYCPSIVY